MTERLSAVFKLIDAANAADPAREVSDGVGRPAALLYGERMSRALSGFAAAPSEELQIAVRGQHIERWKRPRAAYPVGRAGYLQWRRDAAEFHARRLGELMALHGFGADSAERVGKLVRKHSLKTDDESQTLEDVACLVFMRWYCLPFAETRTPDELLKIVQKTAKKMSARGREAALKLPLPPHLVPAILAAG
ncbi:MAG: DUF4202 domain-containing protein [Hyphomicrobium sp.]|nr:DUF4202 domain-containing protein [Hyphomicrobium sp.]